MTGRRPLLGYEIGDRGIRFGTYVTEARSCGVRLFDDAGNATATHLMSAVGEGHYEVLVGEAKPGSNYKFVLDDREFPDPYARHLPEGVDGPACAYRSEYRFKHPSVAPRLAEQVIYEIHVGTFTPEGTYDAARSHLGYLATLGVRSIELMPVASFAGKRGWGYDGVAHYAPFTPYGSPDDLRRFVDEAHGVGLAVVLDVVYNHFGPAGNYLGCFSANYFTKRGTRWGEAPNFGHPSMRRYAIDNAVYWLEEFRFDGLRIDATHAIHDESPEHVLRELAREVQGRGKVLLFAEDERNDPDIVEKLGFDAVWADDFHHQVRVTLTGEKDGYYGSYKPGAQGIADAINQGWLYQGQIYPPTGRTRGRPALSMVAESFVYCIENHDQIGNRAYGDRLSSSASLEAYCAASMLLLFLPMTPLLFMGQEWAASTPFLYFTDHEPELGNAIRDGRRDEFSHFSSFSGNVPDPQAIESYEASKLRWEERSERNHAAVFNLYRELLHLRRSDPVLRHSARDAMVAEGKGDVLVVRRTLGADVRVLFMNTGTTAIPLGRFELPEPNLLPVIASQQPMTPGVLAPRCAAILAGRRSWRPTESNRPAT